MEGARMQQDAQLKRETAAIEAEVEQFKAQKQVELEQFKANNQVQLELFKAQNQAEMARQKTASDNEMEVHRMSFKNEQEQKMRQANGNTKSPDDMLASMMDAIGQSHQHMLSALSKPRKAVIHRDPRTGKVIGAVSVTEG
jgi:cell division septum initiation protein DivIVA